MKYHEIVLNQSKRELILKKMIDVYVGTYPKNNNEYKIEVIGTTVKVLFLQYVKATLTSQTYVQYEELAVFELINNKFVFTYTFNDKIHKFKCELVDLDDYAFYGFLENNHLMNSIKFCYVSLITKYTWLYDFTDKENLGFLFYAEDLSVFNDRQVVYEISDEKQVVAKYNDKKKLSLKKNMKSVNDDYGLTYRYTDVFYYTSDAKSFLNLHELIKLKAHRNQHIFFYIKDSSVYDFIGKRKFYTNKNVTDFVNVFGIINCLKESGVDRLYNFYEESDLSILEIKMLYDKKFDKHDAEKDLKDINKMLKDMEDNRKYLSPRVFDWVIYKDKTIEKLSFKELVNINSKHDSLIKYYNEYNKKLREVKSELQNKEVNERFKLKYKNSVIREFVEFLVSKNHNAYLLDTSNLFVEEGSKQSHCVASYVNSVLNNKSDNYGIIHFEGYTVECCLDRLGVDENIKQCKGINNSVNKEVQAQFYGLIVEFSVLKTKSNIAYEHNKH